MMPAVHACLLDHCALVLREAPNLALGKEREFVLLAGLLHPCGGSQLKCGLYLD